jgi:hypothetical protein
MKSNPQVNIPELNSPDTVWIQWYNDLKQNFGKKQANSLWVMCWNKRGGKTAKGNTVALRSEMEKHGITIDSTFVGSIKDKISGVGDIFDDLFAGTKIFIFASGGLVLLFVGSIVYRNATTGDVNRILGAVISKNPNALKK